jgi:FixJ family two-component response regulator
MTTKPRLSPREIAVCHLLATGGLSDKELAAALSISIHTVRFYLKSIRKKRPQWVSRFAIMVHFPSETRQQWGVSAKRKKAV